MCKYTYTLCRKGDPECECRYFIQRPQYCDRALLPTTTTTKKHPPSSSSSSSPLFFFSSSGKTKNPPPASTSSTDSNRRSPPKPWTPLLSISHSRLGPCDVVMEVVANGPLIHFQSRESFAPVIECEDVEVVEEEGRMEEKYYCPFHSDHEVGVRITLDILDRRRREREQKALEEEKKKKKGKYFKDVVKGIAFAM